MRSPLLSSKVSYPWKLQRLPGWSAIGRSLHLIPFFARGCNKLPTVTYLLCCSDLESLDHLFFRCPFARGIWGRLVLVFSFPRAPLSSSDMWDSWFRELSPFIRLPCSLIARVVLWHIWCARNNCVFNSVFISMPAIFLNICDMYLSWMPAVPSKEMHKLEESIAAVRHCI